jgi:uncharacterized protein YdeI (YjbR/CyaY-like superfamily)
MNPDRVFFNTPAELRRWFQKNHATVTELWIGFYKKDSGLTGVTYKEALDEALCFGWIDGVRKSVDEFSYTIRFTPRKPTSTWSKVNVAHVERLIALGRMKPSGHAAYGARKENRTGIYTYEGKDQDLSAEYLKQLRANAIAWKYYQAQPPWYRRTSGRWVMSAKKEETRLRRLATLIEDSAHQRPIGPLKRPDKAK